MGDRMIQEANSGAVVASEPFTVDVIRRVVVDQGNPAASIPPTYENAEGLEGIPATLHFPASWNTNQAGDVGITLKTTERIVTVVDVPAAGGVAADTITPRDVLQFEDPVYGLTDFKVVQVLLANKPSGLIYVRVEYARND